MLPPMKTIPPVERVLTEAAGIAGNALVVGIGSLALPVVVPIAAAGIAAVSAAALGTYLATETGGAILSELRRRARLREPHPESPSLRGTPTPEELVGNLRERPRTLAVRLRIGSRLADLAPTLDSGNRYYETGKGAKRIASRGRGFKGWLEDHRIKASYGTLMRYKRLATRLRTLLELDERLPLEWLLPHSVLGQEIPRDLLAQHAVARRRLARLLHNHWNFSRLQEHVDAALGIPRLIQARQARASRGKHIGSDTSRHPNLEEMAMENTRRELGRFLQESNLPPKSECLRRDALDWLNSIVPGR